MTDPSPPLVQVGDVLAGKYRVERILGQGAMGMVVAAMHTELHERRAIKFMLPGALDHDEGIDRFLREARACARLKSKHVAAVYDVGRLDKGAPYIVMEYLEGTDLKELLHKRKALPVPEAVTYLLQACEAIGEAHEAGIVHRDLKPANMFMASGVGGVPCIKILDFGIAKLAPAQGLGPDQQEMTATGTIMGSPLYMSPEQMKSSRQVDARSDIWSLGVILYRMVTGAMPFQAPTAPELFALVLTPAPPPPPRSVNPTLAPGLEAIILRCLEKNPAARWQSIPQLVEALEPFKVPGAGLEDKSEMDATTHLWRPPNMSMPQGWFRDTRGGVGMPAVVPPPPPSSSGVHGQSAMPAGGGMGMPAVVPPPSPSSSGVHGQSAMPAGGGMEMPYGAPGVHELGSTSRTGGSWSQTGVGQAPASNARAVAIGLAVGGALFFAGILVVVLLLRGQPTSTAEPAAPSAVEQAAQTAPTQAPEATSATATPVEPTTASASASAAQPEASAVAGGPHKAPSGTGAKQGSTTKAGPPTPDAATPSSTTQEPPTGEALFGDRRK